jgi:pSer/pThr/pTyr-binding forkhead associated (FHA) protein
MATLRRGYARGSLHTETFALRVDRALRARSEDELRGLTADLPAPSRLGRAIARVRAALSTRPAGLLSGVNRGQITLGRSSSCQLVFDDDTVSRRHAALVCRDGAWHVVDLGSSNGTYVNGRRVVDAEVRPGDELTLGGARLLL